MTHEQAQKYALRAALSAMIEKYVCEVFETDHDEADQQYIHSRIGGLTILDAKVRDCEDLLTRGDIIQLEHIITRLTNTDAIELEVALRAYQHVHTLSRRFWA